MIATRFEQEALPQIEALRHYALQLCRDKQRSQDLVQETLFKAYRYFHTYRDGTNCKAWLFQICKNSYINDYRRKQYEPLSTDFQEVSAAHNEGNEEARSLHATLNDEVAEQQHAALFGDEVMNALNTIPTDYQTAVLLSDVEGYTYEEIAEFASVPIGTIRSRIHRGRRMLAGSLAHYARHEGYCSLTSVNN